MLLYENVFFCTSGEDLIGGCCLHLPRIFIFHSFKGKQNERGKEWKEEGKKGEKTNEREGGKRGKKKHCQTFTQNQVTRLLPAALCPRQRVLVLLCSHRNGAHAPQGAIGSSGSRRGSVSGAVVAAVAATAAAAAEDRPANEHSREAAPSTSSTSSSSSSSSSSLNLPCGHLPTEDVASGARAGPSAGGEGAAENVLERVRPPPRGGGRIGGAATAAAAAAGHSPSSAVPVRGGTARSRSSGVRDCSCGRRRRRLGDGAPVAVGPLERLDPRGRPRELRRPLRSAPRARRARPRLELPRQLRVPRPPVVEHVPHKGREPREHARRLVEQRRDDELDEVALRPRQARRGPLTERRDGEARRPLGVSLREELGEHPVSPLLGDAPGLGGVGDIGAVEEDRDEEGPLLGRREEERGRRGGRGCGRGGAVSSGAAGGRGGCCRASSVA